MLRFAGYMIGTAGGATGVWAATGAATNAVVGFATDVLEKAMNDTVIGPSGPGTPAKQEQIRKRREKFGIQEVGSGRSNFERSDSLERGYLATERLRGRADRTKRFYQTLANCHRHQQQVEALDLALASRPLVLLEEQLAKEVILVVLHCSMLAAVGGILHGWMQILERSNAAEKTCPGCVPALNQQAEQGAIDSKMDKAVDDISESHTILEDNSEKNHVGEEDQESHNDDELMAALAKGGYKRPLTPDPAHGMLSSDLRIHPAGSTGNITHRIDLRDDIGRRAKVLSSQSCVGFVEPASSRPTIEEIRRYFIVNEGESLLRPQDSNLDQEVPDKRAHSVPMRFTRVGSGYLAAMDVMDVL